MVSCSFLPCVSEHHTGHAGSKGDRCHDHTSSVVVGCSDTLCICDCDGAMSMWYCSDKRCRCIVSAVLLTVARYCCQTLHHMQMSRMFFQKFALVAI